MIGLLLARAFRWLRHHRSRQQRYCARRRLQLGTCRLRHHRLLHRRGHCPTAAACRGTTMRQRRLRLRDGISVRSHRTDLPWGTCGPPVPGAAALGIALGRHRRGPTWLQWVLQELRPRPKRRSPRQLRWHELSGTRAVCQGWLERCRAPPAETIMCLPRRPTQAEACQSAPQRSQWGPVHRIHLAWPSATFRVHPRGTPRCVAR
mmetsp:Transcript_65932/g.143620  ORF Transcript_65932/g.143620 Transcript_65932/m.143620 type:complete len:205 (-) Transcript_65932:522-1136(-)